MIIYIVTSIIFCKLMKRNSWPCMFTIVEWSSSKINISLFEWSGRKGLGIVSEICSLASLCNKRFSWPLTFVVYLVEFIVIIKLDWHLVCHQRRHTLTMTWNCMEGKKNMLWAFTVVKSDPNHFFCSPQGHSLVFFSFFLVVVRKTVM